MALSDQIQVRRTALGMTQAELARRASISRAYLNRLESSSDGPRPSADVLYRIASALGASVAELLERERSASSSSAKQIPSELIKVANRHNLSSDDVQMLAAIEFRGRRPQTEDDWEFLIRSIERSTRGS